MSIRQPGRPTRAELVLEKSIAKRKRLSRVEDYLLRGVTSARSIATSLGVSEGTVGRYIKEVLLSWTNEDIRKSRLKRTVYIKRLLFAAQESISAWERSKKNQEEITTAYQPTQCKDCEGTGMASKELWCDACDGTGKVMSEIVTRRVKGQAGDPRFIQEFRNCMTEAVKLEGLVINDRSQKGNVIVAETVQIAGLDLSKVPNEALLEAKQSFLRLTSSIRETIDKEDTVIPTTSTEEPDDSRSSKDS